MTTVTNKQSDSLHARIPQDVLKAIDRIALNMGRSRNWIFNEALKQYLDVQQWQTELIEQLINWVNLKQLSPQRKLLCYHFE